jgi:hypothetical protein
MLRASGGSLRSADRHISSRRRHRLVPSIGGAAATLEDRALLSAMGGIVAHAAVRHHLVQAPPPNLAGRPLAAPPVTIPLLPPGSPVGPAPGVLNPFVSTPPPNSSVGPIVV